MAAGTQCGARYWRPYVVQENGGYEPPHQARYRLCGLPLRGMTHRDANSSKTRYAHGALSTWRDASWSHRKRDAVFAVAR